MTVRELRSKLRKLAGDLEVRAVFMGAYYEPSICVVTPWNPPGAPEVLMLSNGEPLEKKP